MPYTVRSTPIADRQIAGLRAARRKAYDRFEEALARQGCAALGYRLTGDAPLPSLCVKHLRGLDRAVVTFSGDEGWVLFVGPHVEGDAAADVYTATLQLDAGSHQSPPGVAAFGAMSDGGRHGTDSGRGRRRGHGHAGGRCP